jgi:hypothetical protein
VTRIKRAVLAAFLLAAVSCGDGVIIFRTNFGTVAGTPTCSGSTGHFDLREQSGLLIVVVINSDTRVVLVGGSLGTCSDVHDGNTVRVQGNEDSGQITAREVQIE